MAGIIGSAVCARPCPSVSVPPAPLSDSLSLDHSPSEIPMSDEPVPPRPSLFARLSARKWHWKDIALFAMGLLLLAVSGYAFRGPLAAAFAKLKAGAKGGQTVSVYSVHLDTENRQYVDILFDKPLGEGHVDEILDPAPATVTPALGGSWKWQDT